MSSVAWPISSNGDCKGGAEAVVEPLPIAVLQDRRYRRRRFWSSLLGVLCAAALHAMLLLAWRSVAPARVEAIGRDDGGGGIALSLVSGIAGIDASASTAPNAADPQVSTEPATDARADSSMTAEPGVGAAGTSRDPNENGHTAGGVAGTATLGSRSITGTGLDPSDFASFAPLRFDQKSEPGFLKQVRRCLSSSLAVDLTLTVVINDAGDVMGVYPAPSMSNGTVHDEPEAVAAVAAAVTRCGPYEGLEGGLTHPLTLIIPAGERGIGENIFSDSQ